MQNSTSYLEEIRSLAHILEKLSKVVKHSDPTAEAKKKELFSKYKFRVQELGRYLKNNVSWDVVKKEIHQFHQEISLSKELHVTIIKKILTDLEAAFIEKHKLTEFEKPSPVRKRKKRKKPIPSKKRDVPEIKREDRVFTRDSLMEMVKLTSKQRDARQRLQALVNKINTLNPDKFEQQIKKYLKEGKK